MMFSKPRRGRGSRPSWSLIVMAIVLGLIVVRAGSTGVVRRVVTGILRRARVGTPSSRRSPVPDAAPDRTSAATTTAGESSLDQADLTRTNEDVVSDAGPALIDTSAGEPEQPPVDTRPEPFDSQAIPEEQPLGTAASAAAQEFADEPDPDSIPADGTSICPIDYPIKGNARSGIYHLPGAFAYERTVPTICFRSPEAAERAGFRAARH